VAVTKSGETSFDLRVSDATKPFWLVLGQSLSPGWKATVGGTDLGAPKLVDGYANGWLVDPASLGRSGTFSVHLDWTPQHRVWVALGLSAVALLLCLLLVFVPGRRWQRRGVLPVALVDPLRREDRSLRVGRAILVVVAAAALSALVVKPLAAPLAVAALLVALALRRGRAVLRLGAAACLVLTALYVLEVQYRYALPNSGQWVQAFVKVSTLSWFVVILLVLDVAVDWIRPAAMPAGASPGPGAGPIRMSPIDPGRRAGMSESEQQPRTVEPTVGGTAGLPGQHAAPGTNRVSEDEIADTVGGAGPAEGGTPGDRETDTASNG
jgi:hypothetical protein